MNRKPLVIIFIVIELLLFLLIHLFESNLEVELRYLTILLCFLFVMLVGTSYDGKLLKLAFIITLIADLFLLVIDDYYLIGVSVFCFVQFIYAYRLLNINKVKYKFRAMVYVVSILITEIIVKIVFEEMVDLLTIVTIIYFVTLINNIINSIFYFKCNYLFSVGLILFGFCDVFVGLSNLNNYISFDYDFTIDFAWLFYIPSQVLIALSVKKLHK